MKLTDEINEELSKAEATKAETTIKTAFNKHLDSLDIDSVQVADVTTENGGDVIITFSDGDGGELDVLFTIDDEDGADAYILDDKDYSDYTDDDEADEMDTVDLDQLDPTTIKISGEDALDLVNLKWLTIGAIEAILDSSDSIEEKRFAYAVRGGKRVKIAMVRRRKKKRITGKQRTAFRKGARKRKLTAKSSARKRKKSLKVRKRMKVKRVKGRSGMLIRK